MTNITVRILSEDELPANIEGLSQILMDTVADGAAISFLQPVSPDQARNFWQHEVLPEIDLNRRSLFGAFLDDTLVGTVQVITALPPNQPHRAEIAKMMLHPTYRRRGIGRRLLIAALDEAKALGKTIVTLDTRTGDPSQSLYAWAGFEKAGEIPDFALDPDGRNLHPTTYMFKRL